MTDIIDEPLPDEVTPEESTEVEETPAGAEAEVSSETQEESAPSDGEETTAEQPKKKGVQKRIDELTQLRYEAERRAEEEARKNAELVGLLKKQQAPEQSGEPQLEQFEDYDQYIVAKAKYELKIEQQAESERQRQDEQNRALNDARRSYAEKASEARSKYSDFEQVAHNPSVPMTDVMEQMIVGSEQGPDIAYYLGSHVEEAYQIARLDPFNAARELGKIEARISLPQKRTTTQAPSPVTTIGSNETVSKKLEDLPYAEYRKARGY